MARRSYRNLSAPRMGERQSIGDGYVESAITALNHTAAQTVALQCAYECKRASTLHMLFRDDDLDKLAAVRGMVKTNSDIKGYPVGSDVTLFIDFAGARWPAIEPSILFLQDDRIEPLYRYIREVRAVHDRFEEAKAVLKWLNRNATPGAIRYYWPTAMKLCKDAPVWRELQGVPQRFTNPEYLGDWIQPLKDAATTVAGSLLLPSDAKPKVRALMWLTFAPQSVHLTLNSQYTTDLITYNI